METKTITTTDMDIAIFRINYKSDFILTLNSDAGWMTPFCIKFWTGAQSQAYYAYYDGMSYTHCAPVEGEPTKLMVQFDDHHLPIGNLKYQIGYHFTVADFPTSVEDEVINQASVIIEVDDAPAQVMLDFNGETAPEIEFSLPAYANEAQRIANEEERIAAETQRISNEEARIAAEETRQQNEQQRISREQQRISQEQQRVNAEVERVNEFASLKTASEAATTAANSAATLANEKAQLAADKAALAQSAATLANNKAQLADDKAQLAAAAAQLANDKAALAQQKAEYAQSQGVYAKAQGDYAKAQGETAQAAATLANEKAALAQQKAEYAQSQGNYAMTQGDYAKAQGDVVKQDHLRAESDHTTATQDHAQMTALVERADTDHVQAVEDHTTATNDHTTAASDHTQAGSDHTQAGQDHQRAENDHTASETATATANQAATTANQAATAANNAAAAAAQATQEMEQDVQTLIENTDAVLGADDIPQFDVTETYAIGDFVMKDGNLYKFLTGHAPGAWNPQEVQQTNLVYEVNSMVKSDYEEVIIDLKNEDDDPMPNVEVVVKVEGEQSGRNLTTDAQGRCTTDVQRGLEYTVDVNTPAGYQHTGQIWHRASLPTRLISIILQEDTSSQYEHVQVTLSYSDSSLGVADHIIVSYDGVDYSAPVVNNVAEYDIPLGKTYTVSFPDIEGYVTPRSRTRTAEFNRTYTLHVWYHAAVAGIRWIFNNGSEKELNEATLEDYSNIFGLIVNVSELANANTGYIIPLDVMVNGGGSGNWLSANEGIDSMENFTSHAAALTDLDGEQNCQKIRDHIAYQAAVGITRTSGIAQTVYNRCGGVGVKPFANNVQYVVGDLVSYQNMIYRFTSDHKGNWNAAHVEEYGVGYIMPSGELQRCFQVAYGQIYPYRVVFQQVRDFMATTFGVTPVNVASGYWWTSAQYSDTTGVYLNGGSFNLSIKTHSNYTLLPALAY